MLEIALKKRELLYQGCAGKIEPSKGGIEEFLAEHGSALFEEKYDGQWGGLSHVPGDARAIVTSRNGKTKNPVGVLEYASKFLDSRNAGETILAGELGFGSQAETELANKTGHHRYIAYDVIVLRGAFVGNQPLLKRKELLRELLAGADKSFLVESEWRIESTVQAAWDYYREVLDRNGEGLIAKLPETTYTTNGGKIREWFKIKKTVSKEFRIVGYEDSDAAKYKKFGWIKNILLAEISDPEDNVVVHLGSMDEKTRADVSKNKEAFIGKIVEVGGNEIFKSGSVRHPFFVRFRDDL